MTDTMNIISKTEPWEHQRKAYCVASSHQGAMLALDMGTGKSKCAIDLIVHEGHAVTLIVCPLSVMDVWPHQFSLHAGKPIRVVALKNNNSTAARARIALQKYNEATVRGEAVAFITNYESLPSTALGGFFLDLAKRGILDCVVLDESHRIKAPAGKTSWYFSTLSRYVKRRLALTGTPMPHSPLDIYAQYRFIDKSIFGTSFVRFRHRYALMGGYQGKQVTGFQNLDELHEKMYRIAYRVTKDEVLDLPPQMFETIPVTLGPRARRVYKELEEDLIALVDQGVVTAGNALVKLLRLQQVTSGFIKPDGPDGRPSDVIVPLDADKIGALQDILKDLPPTEPVVVFCRFRRDLEFVNSISIWMDRAYYELSGKLNTLAEWQESSSLRGGGGVLGVQIQAGGLGVDLTAARYAVYYSMGFSLGDYEQSLARLHRPGQEHTVTYYHLIATDTVDEKVMLALKAKKNVVESVLNFPKRT